MSIKRITLLLAMLAIVACMCACDYSGKPANAGSQSTQALALQTDTPRDDYEIVADDAQYEYGTEVISEMKLVVQIEDSVFYATLEKNEAVNALISMMREAPVVINMSDYAGFEKVGALGKTLPASNNQTTTQAGDIVLYNGNQIVIFYGSNAWSYTRLGRIDDLSGWKEALGNSDVTVTFSISE